MPTSSERLKARANAYGVAIIALTERESKTDDALEAEECSVVAYRLGIEYDRLYKLANTRAEKEQGLEHRRSRT